MKEIGIYIHIPFCKQKCEYCDFISFANKEQLIKEYIRALKQEITKGMGINKSILNFDEFNVSTIYIGGGTPSFIDTKYIIEILNVLKEKWHLKNPEITIEVNPGTVTKKKLEDYYNNGINRLSIGLQETNNELLKIIGRIHNYEQFLETYSLARKTGFKNINVDLMIGLPTQTMKNVKQSLTKIKELNPEHVSVYSLIVEEDTNLEKRISKKEIELPSEDIERKMYWLVKKTLEKEGFKHYEISNFAKPNYESKHNTNCWKQKEYIGYGLASHSYLNNTRYSNTDNLNKYLNNENKTTIHEIQNKKMKMKEYILLGLRKIDGVKISKFKENFIENPLYIFRKELNKLINEDLVEVDDDSIKLTNKGIDLANLVWKEFI